MLEQAPPAVRRSVTVGARGDGDMVDDTECRLCAHGVVGEVERDPFGEGRPRQVPCDQVGSPLYPVPKATGANSRDSISSRSVSPARVIMSIRAPRGIRVPVV